MRNLYRLALLAAAVLCALTLIDAHEATTGAMLGTTAVSRRLDIVEARLTALQVCVEIDLTDSDKLAALEYAVIRLESARRRVK